jgi:hypothetical protein
VSFVTNSELKIENKRPTTAAREDFSRLLLQTRNRCTFICLSKKTTIKSVPIALTDLAEMKVVYSTRFAGGPPLKDASLIRFMAIRGCEAFKAELATLPRLRNPDDPAGREPKANKTSRSS